MVKLGQTVGMIKMDGVVFSLVGKRVVVVGA